MRITKLHLAAAPRILPPNRIISFPLCVCECPSELHSSRLHTFPPRQRPHSEGTTDGPNTRPGKNMYFADWSSWNVTLLSLMQRPDTPRPRVELHCFPLAKFGAALVFGGWEGGGKEGGDGGAYSNLNVPLCV